MGERTTSAAKDVEFSSYRENAMDRTESMGADFERAHDGTQQQQPGQEQQSQEQGREVRHVQGPQGRRRLRARLPNRRRAAHQAGPASGLRG